jgi:uncharacterized membrane protein YraQ (UPF0718 family)
MNAIKKHKFLVLSILLLVVLTFINVDLTIKALNNAGDQILSMLIIVPPIFVLIGLFDVWVPRETIIKLMGQESGIKGMALAFLLGGFSAGPTIAAFPIAMVMLKKGAKYSNVLFFLMVWSSLKLPILFYQVTTIGLTLSVIINATMLVVFILGALFAEKLFTKEEKELFERKAQN